MLSMNSVSQFGAFVKNSGIHCIKGLVSDLSVARELGQAAIEVAQEEMSKFGASVKNSVSQFGASVMNSGTASDLQTIGRVAKRGICKLGASVMNSDIVNWISGANQVKKGNKVLVNVFSGVVEVAKLHRAHANMAKAVSGIVEVAKLQRARAQVGYSLPVLFGIGYATYKITLAVLDRLNQNQHQAV